MENFDLIKEKMDPILREKISSEEKGMIPVIVQTVDGYKSEDRKNIETLGGSVKDDLYIINAFSADIPISSIKLLALNSRVKKIFYDEEVRAI